MILQSLRELAHREELVSEPTFESRGVAWIIKIDRGGRFLSLQSTLPDTAVDAKGKKTRPQAAMMSIPRRCIRSGSKIKADFLCDKSEYVFGVLPEGAPAAKDADKHEKCRRAFLSTMEDAASKLHSPLLDAVVLFLQNDDQRAACVERLSENKWASNDLITFSCEGTLLPGDASIRKWWASSLCDVPVNSEELRQCLVCGEPAIPVENHDKLKVPGATSSGVPLVSFNMDSFLKYGLPGHENAPICRACMTAYVEGLRRCLNERYPNPRSGEMMGQQSVRLSPDTTAVYWTDIPWELAPFLSFLLNKPEDFESVLCSPYKGSPAGKLEGTFFCIVLSGAQGRAMLRSVHTGTVAQVEHSLEKYFDALRLDGYDKPLPLYALLNALASQGKSSNLPPKLPGEVFLSAVLGRPLPQLILNAAVGRNRAEQKVTPSRAALLQLYFSRYKLEVPRMSLSLEFHEPGYLFGRLFAVLERVQTLANPGVSTTIVDRFFGSASTRPGVVFPQLLRLNQAHLAKVPSKRNPNYYRKLIGEIMDGLPAALSPTLDLNAQGMFALGYYHQRQAFFKKSDAVGEAETSPDAAVPNMEEGETA